jgi:hypothetical protein
MKIALWFLPFIFGVVASLLSTVYGFQMFVWVLLISLFLNLAFYVATVTIFLSAFDGKIDKFPMMLAAVCLCFGLLLLYHPQWIKQGFGYLPNILPPNPVKVLANG